MDEITRRLWFITGLPCSGKSYGAQLLVKELRNATLLSTGDIARELSSKEVWATTEKNDLFPLEDLLRKELKTRIEKAPTNNVVIDGFPRFDEQAEYLANTYWNYRPEIIEVNAGDQSTLRLRAKNRARDARDTDEFQFLSRLNTASHNLSGALTVIHRRLGLYHTLMSADTGYMVRAIQRIIKECK